MKDEALGVAEPLVETHQRRRLAEIELDCAQFGLDMTLQRMDMGCRSAAILRPHYQRIDAAKKALKEIEAQ